MKKDDSIEHHQHSGKILFDALDIFLVNLHLNVKDVTVKISRS